MRLSLRKIARRYSLTPNTLRYRVEYRAIKQLLAGTRKPFPILADFGAGSGEMSALLVESGTAQTAIGIEPDPANFRLLQQRYAFLSGSRCINNSLEEAIVEPESVDAVLSTQVLEHIADHHAAVARIHRILKPAGYAIISVPHPPELFPNPGHVRPGYTKDELTALFSRHGFKLVEYDYFLTLPTLRRMVAAEELGLLGRLLPIGWADREAKLTRSEKEALQPYGVACLFSK